MTRWLGTLFLGISLSACSWTGSERGQANEANGYEPDKRPLATTLVYDCNGFDFIARLGPGEMAVWLPDQYVVLSQVRSASGTQYAEGDIVFWSKGENAMLSVGDQQYLNCQLQPHRVPWEDARRRGVDFRAVGNEPGWHVEVRGGEEILFVTDYGMQRVVVPQRGQGKVGSARVYQGSTALHSVRVDILDQDCVDTMSGETFPNDVAVTLDDTLYHGCGQFLDYPWQDLE